MQSSTGQVGRRQLLNGAPARLLSRQRPRVTLTAVASELCLGCGICCDGSLFSSGPLEPEEVPVARRLGLVIEDGDFRQPCARLDVSTKRCGVYAERPSACRAYRCELLVELERGAVSIEQARASVRRLRELVGALPGDATTTLAERVRAEGRRIAESCKTPELRAQSAGRMLDLAELERLRQRFERT